METTYINLDRIMPMVWQAINICLDWLQTHGISITLNGNTSELSFFTLIISGLYIYIACTYLPILYELASDTYHPLSEPDDDDD